MAKQSQASIKRSIKNLRLIIDGKNVDPITKRMAYFAENTLRWAIEDTEGWRRPEVDLEDEVVLLLKEQKLRSDPYLACTGCGFPPVQLHIKGCPNVLILDRKGE